MKKKLIAAMTSVAMVATMVPAVAFAGTDAAGASPTAKTKVAQKAATYSGYDDIKAALAAGFADDPTDGASPTAYKATYDKKGDYDALDKAIKALSPTEQAKMATETGYDNFQKGKKAIDDMDALISLAKDAIQKIPNSIGAKDSKVTAARAAYTKVDDLTKVSGTTSGTINKLGVDRLGKGYTAEEAVGAANVKALETAEAIDAVAVLIGQMDAVDKDNYANYAAVTSVKAATDAYEKLGADKNRVANKAAYNAKIQGAEDTKAAKTAMDKVDADITKATTPYTQAKLTAAKAALDAAIKAVKAIPSTVKTDAPASGLGWDAIIDDGGNDKYTAGTAHTKIADMEKYVEADAAVRPVVDAINGLGKVEDLKWSTATKDKVFAVTYAYGQLSGASSSDTGSQKEFLKDNYQAADAAYEKLVADAAGGWIKQEGQNLAAAINWMTAKIDAIPGTIALASKAAIDEAEKAYGEYATGYLQSLSVKSSLPSASTRKLADAMKKLEELEADKLKADKAAAKPFLDLMGDKGTATTLWYKAITVDALKISDKALVQEARAAYDKLTDDQKALTVAKAGAGYDVVGAYEALQKAEQTIAELEGKGSADAIANGLVVAIRALPAKDKLTLANKDAVYALNDQYLAAIEKNADVEAKVGNKADLFAAVGAIMDLEIAELPILKADGTETKAAIDEAAAKIDAVKARYDKIGKEQQAEVLKTSALDSAVSQLSKAQVKYASDALEAALKIDATKELSKEDAAAIKLAKEAIDALSKTQAAGLDQAKVKALDETLLPALEAYEKSIRALENATISISAQTYTGSDLTPTVKVTDKAGNVVAGENYRVVFDDNREVGTATATIIAISGSDYTGSKDATFAIGQASIAKASVGGVTDKTYTGKQIKPTVKVVVSGRTLKNGTDYTVSYGKNTSLGKGSVKITAKGNYAGTIGKTFKIKPAKETISSLKAGKKKFTVKFKKQSGATNYQIHYDAKGVKAKTVRTTKTTKTVTKLKKGKKYVVKVRAYKKIDGKPFYGAYSKKKTVKVK